MTTLQMQFAPPYQASLTEDPMELTSDLDQRTGDGDEIDIDLDLTGDNPLDGEDEFMDEEDMNTLAESTSVDGQESHAANDDEMADDSYAQGQADEGSSVRDEDIEDAEYTGPELDEDTFVEPEIDQPSEKSVELLTHYEDIVGGQNHEQDYQEHLEQEHNEQEYHELPTTPKTESGVIQRALPDEQTGLVNPSPDLAKVLTIETSDGNDVEVHKEAIVNHGAVEHFSESPDVEGLTALKAKLEQTGEEFLPASLGLEIVPQSNIEGSHTQEENARNSPAHLHPVVLDYQGNEMYLFPPVDNNGDPAATFLLADEQLAYSAVGNLLEACRGVLKGSLSEQDELMINIDDLDLQISESSIESASTTLSEVVDLYVRLQQNDGLENPPPLYMDLTSRNGFARRLDVLRNGLMEGKGLSQLKSSQETENDQQHRIESEIDPSSHTAVLSTKETYPSEQQPGKEAEKSLDRRHSHSNLMSPEKILLQTTSAPKATQSYPITDVAHEENNHTVLRFGSDNSPHEVGINDEFFGEAARPREPLEPAQPLAGASENNEAEGSIVDDGDFIDYEDVEELEGGTSSASSTLQGDAIDIIAVQDHAVLEEPIIAENHEHRYPHSVPEIAVANEESLHAFVGEKDTSDVGVPVEEEQSDPAQIPSEDRDDKGQSLSGQSDEEREAPEDDQDAKLRPEIDSDDDQHETSAQYEDDAGSYQHGILQEHAEQTKGEAYPVTDTSFNVGTEDYSMAHPFQSESGGSGRSFRDDDLGRANNLEAENELQEVHRSLTTDDHDNVPHSQEEANTRPPYVVEESAQTQEDDDEITYEDEEHDNDFAHEPANAEHNFTTSLGSLKRARSLHEDDVRQEEDLQRAKYVRTG